MTPLYFRIKIKTKSRGVGHMNDDELDNSERSLFGVVAELIALACKSVMLLIGSIFGILASLGMLYICIKLLA